MEEKRSKKGEIGGKKRKSQRGERYRQLWERKEKGEVIKDKWRNEKKEIKN